MTPGELRHRVEILSVGTAAGAGATATDTDTVMATVWGALSPVADRDRQGTVNRADAATHRVTIRYRSDVSAAKWITARGRRMRVVGVRDPGEDSRWLELSCVEERDS